MLSALLHMLTSQNNPQGPQGNIRQPNALLHIRYLCWVDVPGTPATSINTPHWKNAKLRNVAEAANGHRATNYLMLQTTVQGKCCQVDEVTLIRGNKKNKPSLVGCGWKHQRFNSRVKLWTQKERGMPPLFNVLWESNHASIWLRHWMKMHLWT